MPPAKTRKKPEWPYFKSHGVKMTAHKNGQWAKKIHGKIQYFGVWADPQGALDRYLDNAADLHAGLDVQTTPSGIVTVADCFNEYLAHRKADMTTGRNHHDITDQSVGPTMIRRYMEAGKICCGSLGRNRPAEGLVPADFIKIKRAMEKRFSSESLAGYIRYIRTVFGWAYDTGLIERPARFGPDFKAFQVRRQRRLKRQAAGKKFLPPETIRALIGVASVHVQAMIYLGINGGFYAADCGDLPKSAIDFDRNLIEFPRFKTLVPRIVPLWAETADALKQAIAVRPKPKDPSHNHLAFITRRGGLWTIPQGAKFDDDGNLKSVIHMDNVSQEFCKLFGKAKLERPKGCGFSWLRHTFYTVARQTRDYDAVNMIQGHARSGMVEHYLEEVPEANLRAVVDHVHQWLFTRSAE